MNILVLGATGTIGTPLTQRLHDDGHAVTAWSRRTHGDLSTQLIPLDMVEGTELIIDVTDAKRRSSMLSTMATSVVSSRCHTPHPLPGHPQPGQKHILVLQTQATTTSGLRIVRSPLHRRTMHTIHHISNLAFRRRNAHRPHPTTDRGSVAVD